MNRPRLTHALVSAALALPAATALAQPMPDTARALKTLMEGGAGNGAEPAPMGAASGASAMPQAAPTPNPMMTHTVRPGETLARVVHQVYGSHPYKDAPVFRLIVQRNPEAFIGGNHNRLKAGAMLALPNPAELHAALTAQHPQFQSVAARPTVAPVSGGAAAATSPAAGKSSYPGPSAAAGQSTSSSDPRRGWVRFP